jgi:predicted transposase YdaD
MFQLHDIRKTRVWQEAHEEGVEQGIKQGRALQNQHLVQRLRADGRTQKEIAKLLGISAAEVRRLARG